MPTTDIVLDLQVLLLRAVLLAQPLPGQNEPVQLPDWPFFQPEPVIYLAQENLAGPLSLTDLQKPVSTVSVDEIKALAHGQDNVPFLKFLEPDVNGDEVGLTLVAMIAPKDVNNRVLGLGGVHVVFAKTAAGWEVKDSPVYSAF